MTIFLAGGGPTAPVAEACDMFVVEAQGGSERVAIAVPGHARDAADLVTTLAEPILRRWPQAQIEPVWLVGAEETMWPEAPEDLAGFVLAGDDTAAVLDSLMPRRDLVARLVRRQAPYLGYGSGTVVAARHVIVGGWRHAGRQVAPQAASEGHDCVTIRDGLGLIGATTQPFADTSCLLERAVAALQIGPATAALALDEGICLAVSAISGATRVFGTGRLAWLTHAGDQIALRFERVGQTESAPSSEPDASD